MKKLVVITKNSKTGRLKTEKYLLDENPKRPSLKIGAKCILITTVYRNYPVIYLGTRKGFKNPSYLVWNPYTNEVDLTHTVGNHSFIDIEWTDKYLKEKNATPLKDYYDKIDFTAPELVFNFS